MYWEEAIEIAKNQLVTYDYWEEVTSLAHKILQFEAKKIATWEHENYLKSPEWILKKEKILERDSHTCQDCLKITPKIFELFSKIEFEPFKLVIPATEVHHLDYQYKQTSLEEEYCISLCRKHHQLRHITNKEDAEWLIKDIENYLLIQIYDIIISQPKYQKIALKQHKDWINSITIKPSKFF